MTSTLTDYQTSGKVLWYATFCTKLMHWKAIRAINERFGVALKYARRSACVFIPNHFEYPWSIKHFGVLSPACERKKERRKNNSNRQTDRQTSSLEWRVLVKISSQYYKNGCKIWHLCRPGILYSFALSDSNVVYTHSNSYLLIAHYDLIILCLWLNKKNYILHRNHKIAGFESNTRCVW